MTHKQWKNAAEWRDISKKPYWSIKHPSQLFHMTIRQLKQLAMQMNKHLGIIIAKPLSRRLQQRIKRKGKWVEGRTLSEMKHADLIECIWYVRKVQMSKPTVRGEWEFGQLSFRVFEFNAPTGEAWVHYVGFDNEQQAYKQYQYMMDKGLCQLAALRQGERTGYAWEVKYWGIDPGALQVIINKDTPVWEEPTIPAVAPIESVEKVEQEVDRVWDLATRAQRYTTLLVNGGKAGMLIIAQELFGQNWEELTQVPTKNMWDVRSEYNRRHGLPPPFWEIEGKNAGRFTTVLSKPMRPYKPWTSERKIRNRLRLLHKRMEKKWSLIDFRQEELFKAVLQQPQYYGMCPLPGAVKSSCITLPNLEKEAAIAKEIMLREIESGQLQPVNIPLSLKEPEKEVLPHT